MGLDDVLHALRADPARAAVFSDLDGTLSLIVDDPDTVVPVDGAPQCLTALAKTIGMVAIVSGRPVAFLERFFAPPIELSGLYGLEHRTGDRLLVDSTAIEWLPVMSTVANDARVAFGTEAVEDKHYSITVHYRGADEPFVADVLSWADRVAAETGLDARSAKMSVELHPPSSRSKGDAVEDLLIGATSAVYFGDDTGDLPAFTRLAELHAAGSLDAYAVVLVKSHETDVELHEHATNVVDTPEEVLQILQSMLHAASGREL